ncbi:cytochrome P450 [Polychytrium aggregatum]|uniref:cytochrome P450 n=1 Tax=Polychytrium aggregatum TaxID=110093 RepID=UPI0022FDE120|nr:cytochrome P450 [Polychytrium aggregatum]KAI9205317.1 cytochrome P450 [Polychytrium aggregatum]
MTLVRTRSAAVLLGSLAGSYLAWNYVRYLVRAFRSPLRKLPAASDTFWAVILGPLDRFRIGIKTFFNHIHCLHQKHGPVVVTDANTISVADPELVKLVLVTHDFPKPASYSTTFRFVGHSSTDSLFSTTDKLYHRRMRRTLSHSFGLQELGALEPFMDKCITSTFDHLDYLHAQEASGNPAYVTIDLWRFLGCFALDVIGETAFGLSFNMIEKQAHPLPSAIVRRFYFTITAYVFPWIRYLFFLPGVRDERADLSYIEAFMRDIIQQRRKTDSGPKRGDLLQRIIEAKDPETGEPLTDEEVAANTVMFLIAGSETTGNTMSFALIKLLENPRALKQLVAEIDAAHVEPTSGLISHDTAKSLPYLNAVIYEVLRLVPVVAGGPLREFPSDMIFGGYFIPKNTRVVVSTIATHHNPQIWTEPDEFLPERFLDLEHVTGVFKSHEAKGELLPFSSGSRNCIGRNFALMEIRLFLANFLRKYEIEDVPGQAKDLVLAVTLRLASETYRIKIKPRTGPC